MRNGKTLAGNAPNVGQPSRPIWAQALLLLLLMISLSGVSGCAAVVGAGPKPPQPVSAFQLNPNVVDFGTVTAGSKVPQQVSVLNTGTAPITITALTVSTATFSVSGATLPLSLPAGQSMSFSVWFSSATTGKSSATLTAQADGGVSPAVITLTGTASPAPLSLSSAPTSLSFGDVKVGATLTQNLVITNTGTSDVTITQINLNAKDVTVSGATLPVTVSATQSLNLTVQYKPLTPSAISGNVTLADAQGGSFAVGVTGNGLQGILTAGPSPIAFGTVAEGMSNSQQVQLLNSGTGTLTISQVTISGSGFSISGLTVPLTLAAGQGTSFSVLFTPQSANAVTGILKLDSNGANSSNILNLSGTGVAPVRTLSVSQASLDFGSVAVGSTSSQAVVLTNTGNSNVTISQISENGAAFALAGAATPIVLSPAQSTSITVNFNPAAAGSASGTVTVVSDATGSPNTVSLSGRGFVPSPHTVLLTWTASTSTVSGYYVYRSTIDGTGYTRLNASSVSNLDYTDNQLQSGLTYYYVTTAVDGAGLESAYSNQTSAIIP
ncbi:MAG TPA: choice-of-anchor D domain-containing protein [Candidatus Dormibacteraeota bacterium]|nr:choice-of-anchor D domain-containing protein [Candidatus Dormibacteraeota bacterium]